MARHTRGATASEPPVHRDTCSDAGALARRILEQDETDLQTFRRKMVDLAREPNGPQAICDYVTRLPAQVTDALMLTFWADCGSDSNTRKVRSKLAWFAERGAQVHGKEGKKPVCSWGLHPLMIYGFIQESSQKTSNLDLLKKIALGGASWDQACTLLKDARAPRNKTKEPGVETNGDWQNGHFKAALAELQTSADPSGRVPADAQSDSDGDSEAHDHHPSQHDPTRSIERARSAEPSRDKDVLSPNSFSQLSGGMGPDDDDDNDGDDHHNGQHDTSIPPEQARSVLFRDDTWRPTAQRSYDFGLSISGTSNKRPCPGEESPFRTKRQHLSPSPADPGRRSDSTLSFNEDLGIKTKDHEGESLNRKDLEDSPVSKQEAAIAISLVQDDGTNLREKDERGVRDDHAHAPEERKGEHKTIDTPDNAIATEHIAKTVLLSPDDTASAHAVEFVDLVADDTAEEAAVVTAEERSLAIKVASETLLSGSPINDEIISALLAILGNVIDECYIASSHVIRPTAKFKKLHGYDPTRHKNILFPVHFEASKHWTIAIVWPSLSKPSDPNSLQGHIRVYDPLPGEPFAEETFRVVGMIAHELGLSLPHSPWMRSSNAMSSTFSQVGYTDCGIYIVVYALCFLSGVGLPCRIFPRVWRRWFAVVLGTVDEGDILDTYWSGLVEPSCHEHIAGYLQKLALATSSIDEVLKTDIPLIRGFVDGACKVLVRVQDIQSHIKTYKNVLATFQTLANPEEDAVDISQRVERKLQDWKRVFNDLSQTIARVRAFAGASLVGPWETGDQFPLESLRKRLDSDKNDLECYRCRVVDVLHPQGLSKWKTAIASLEESFALPTRKV